MVEGEMHQLDGAVALQFAQDVGAMHVHRFMAEIELERDLLYAVAFDQQIEDFTLARGQHFQRRGRLIAAAQRPQRVGAQVMAPHIDGTHRLHQLFRPAAFGQIAAGAGVQRALHEGRGVIDAEDDRAELRLLRPQAFQQAEAVFIRHGDVHHRDADVVAQQCRPGRRRAAVLPHHVEIILEVEQLRKAGAHHHMVIHQYHTDHFSHSVAESWPYDACRHGAGNQPSAVMQSV
jgi:hypothetical protein